MRLKDWLLLGTFIPHGMCFADGDPPAEGAGAGGGEAPPPEGGEAGDPPAGGEPPAGEGESGEEPPPVEGRAKEGAAPPEPEAPKTPFDDPVVQKQLGRQHRQLQESKREADELRASLEAAQETLKRLDPNYKPEGATPPARPAAAQPAGFTAEDVKREAARQRAQERFDEEANKADATGKERYKAGWDKATETLKNLGGFDPDTMNGILATDDPAQVLYTLGTQPEQYQRIMDLPPHKRLAEMVKMAMPKPKASQRPSGAAPPQEPVRARNQGDQTSLSDELTDEEWYRRRDKQRAERRAARQGRQVSA